MSFVQNAKKVELRKTIKNALSMMTPAERVNQSAAIQRKIFDLEVFKSSTNVSVYLSTDGEVDTKPILEKLFQLNKKVYVPTYNGPNMEMVRLVDMKDYDSLPLTKWNIKQPNFKDNRENALLTGLDLILMPGVAFAKPSSRCGHGRGYYDKFLHRHFDLYPKSKTTLVGLAFKEQCVSPDEFPLDPHDYPIDIILTSE